MKTLETTTTKVNGLKSYNVTAHNLRSCKYALNLMSKPSENLCGSIVSMKFETLEEAEKAGIAFLNTDFEGIFANKKFARTWGK